MLRIQRLLILLSLLLIATVACQKETHDDVENAPAVVKKYPHSTDGLHELMQDLSNAVRGQELESAVAIADSLWMKAPKAWFTTAYGDALGETLYADFQPKSESVGLLRMLKRQIDLGRTEFTVEKFEDPTDPNATAYQSAALLAQVVPTPLYSWRANAPGETAHQHVSNFIWAEGGWKLVGPMRPIKPGLTANSAMIAMSKLRNRDLTQYFETGKTPKALELPAAPLPSEPTQP